MSNELHTLMVESDAKDKRDIKTIFTHQLLCFSRLGGKLKGYSASFLHYSVITGFGKYHCICEIRSIKPLMAPEEAPCHLINCLC